LQVSSADTFLGRVQKYSLPLIVGVLAGLAAANLAPDTYHALIDAPIAGLSVAGHPLTLHFLVNDLFMVLFFGLAAKEITHALLPGGALNPPSRAINPLLGTLGGVVGPALTFVLLTGYFLGGTPLHDVVVKGWGIPTATDIALAWLLARIVFGDKHPAVDFLLLLAVADDAIGLGIIAVFYPNPAAPVKPEYLGYVVAAMGVALLLRHKLRTRWVPTVLLAGGLSWYGLFSGHLHPALALVFVVPFLPRNTAPGRPSPLDDFEHALKAPVTWGLFLFSFANAGVELAHIGTVSAIVVGSLLIGKTVGISLMSWLGALVGFPLPPGMDVRSLLVVGAVASLGLTVALFVAALAYTDPQLQAEAKMGALLSAAAFPIAIILGRVLRIRRITE